MKKIKIVIVSVLSSIFLLSCQDAYEIEPIGILDDEATFNTVEDAQIYLNGIYGGVSNSSEIYFTSVFTDEVAPSPGYNGADRDLHRFVLNSTTALASTIWVSNYLTINRVNRLIAGVEYIDNVEDSEQAELNNILAQARTLRALSYLNLLSYYSPDMTNDGELGVILFTHVPLADEKLPRSTNAECFALIEEDLTFAANNISSSNSYIFPTRALVEAMRARMYAYRGDYPNARTHALNTINNYGLSLTQSTPFDLSNFYDPYATTNPYRQIWDDYPGGTGPSPADQYENIFSLQSLVSPSEYGFSIAGNYYFNQTHINGSPIWGMGLNLYAELEDMPDDVRAYAFVDPTSDMSQNAVMIDKYPGIPGAPLRNNVKLFRLSEMYFILAEAAVSANQLGDAAGYLHQIRIARSTTGSANAPSFSNPTEAWGEILDERRKELCFEGHRYVDLKRLGVLANKSIDRSTLDDENPSLPTTISNTDHRFTLPIPLSEINGNPGIQQNPGY